MYLPLQRRNLAENTELYLNDVKAEILGCDKKTGCLKVRLHGEVTDARIAALEVYSDISFLVRRLLNWSMREDIDFAPAKECNAIPAPDMSGLSPEQQNAVMGVLSSPLCYVWGVPGSGKTCMVLAECITAYIRQGRRVLLVAPTNSSLERALSALLPELSKHGCSEEVALRLGVPSDEFAEKHPLLCRGLNSGAVPKLLSVTADSFIGYYDDIRRFNPDHVFLDEAGYCPLIKALPLLSLDKPLTMLGDHKQLPPVCQLKDREIVREPALCLWSLSAAYMGNLFKAEGMDELLSANTPDFSALPRFDLGTSFRFGEKIANALSEEVYGGILHSAGKGTEISILHAPSCGDRTSLSEVRVIQRYLKEHPSPGCAILTPYCKQVRLLREKLPHQEVMTIHRAQGLEWDTVIISAVDAEDMFFTDSTKPKGQALINTAISRAKKRLVIACDTEQWSNRPNQLLGRLVNSFSIAA